MVWIRVILKLTDGGAYFPQAPLIEKNKAQWDNVIQRVVKAQWKTWWKYGIYGCFMYLGRSHSPHRQHRSGVFVCCYFLSLEWSSHELHIGLHYDLSRLGLFTLCIAAFLFFLLIVSFFSFHPIVKMSFFYPVFYVQIEKHIKTFTQYNEIKFSKRPLLKIPFH